MFNKINTQLENLFEQPSKTALKSEQGSAEMQSEMHIGFQPGNITLLENLSYIFSDVAEQTSLLNLFSQLSSYFEIGFLLKNTDSNIYKVIGAFAFMQKLKTDEISKHIKLPNPGLYKILKTDAHQILNYFDMKDLNPQKKMLSYLIPLTDSYTIIVMTQTAEPWVGLKIEALQKTLMKINFYL